MDIQRAILLSGIFAVLFLLLLQWNKFEKQNTPAISANKTETLASAMTNIGDAPTDTTISASADIPDNTPISTDTSAAIVSSGPLVDVKTDVLHLKIDYLTSCNVNTTCVQEMKTPPLIGELDVAG